MKIPFSSEAPDAVQKLIGEPGGAGTFEKAAIGILVTVGVVWILMKLLKRFGRPKP